MGSRLFPSDVLAFFKAHNRGRSAREITALLNDTFGTNYTEAQIKSCRAHMHWDSGLTGRFEKGHTPYNKGTKGHSFPGMKATQFKARHRPHNARPVGTELMNTDGYLVRKIAEPNVWKPVRILNWEAANGPVPEKHVVIFKDRDKLNCALPNLLLVSRAELAVMNKRGLCTQNAEATEAGLNLARYIQATCARKKRRSDRG